MNISPEQVPSLEENLGKLRGIVEKARTTNKSVEQSTVFYNRVSNHFSYLDIITYRGLENLKIDKLSKINLFAGINNSGKTSLLEAVYLLCKQNDFGSLVDILRRRGKIPEGQISAKWLADQINNTIKLKAVFDNNNCDVELKSFDEENSSIDRSVYLKSVEITTHYENYELESITRILQGIGRETQADTIKILCPTVFSSPFFLNEPFNYTGFYHKSVQSKLLPKIISFIGEKFIHTVKDIRLVDEFQRFLVIDDDFEKALDLTSYGEGLQRIFFTSLLFASAENGIVLIDEFENAIHIELLEIFAAFIHSLACEFNVQVFLTSHSKECIDSFIKSVPADQKNDFSFHALVKGENGKINSRDFDGEKYFKLLEAGDVDLRRAQ
jgi:AAA15 family ATPase/GTPase